MPPELIPNVSNLVTAIVVALITFYLTRRHDRKTQERNRRQAACDRFRQAVAHEIDLWHRLGAMSRGVIGSLDRSLPELQNSPIIAALIEFRPFVKGKTEEYDNACSAYEAYKKKVSGDPWGFSGSHLVPLRLLDDLLHFANE